MRIDEETITRLGIIVLYIELSSLVNILFLHIQLRIVCVYYYCDIGDLQNASYLNTEATSVLWVGCILSLTELVSDINTSAFSFLLHPHPIYQCFINKIYYFTIVFLATIIIILSADRNFNASTKYHSIHIYIYRVIPNDVSKR